MCVFIKYYKEKCISQATFHTVLETENHLNLLQNFDVDKICFCVQHAGWSRQTV